MSKDIDLREGAREFSVPTSVVREGVAYMGPNVLVNARDEKHAIEKVEQAGHRRNTHFEVKER